MPITTLTDLQLRSEVVKDEVAISANTAPRIGSLFLDTIDTLSALIPGGVINEEVLVFPSSGDFPLTGEVNTIYIDESDDIAYYWNGTEYKEFTSSGDLIVIRSLSDLDVQTTSGLYRVKWIIRSPRQRPNQTRVVNYRLNVTNNQGLLSQSLESREGYMYRGGTTLTWYPWSDFVYAYATKLIEHAPSEGTSFNEYATENEYHLFSVPLTYLELSKDIDNINSCVFDFTAGVGFVLVATDFENLFNATINDGDRVIISIRMGVMEIRKILAAPTTVQPKSYTLDFQVGGELIQDVNILGLITIEKVIAFNCSKVYLSYDNIIKQEVTFNDPLNVPLTISIADGELLTWEIERITDDELASVGVLITL